MRPNTTQYFHCIPVVVTLLAASAMGCEQPSTAGARLKTTAIDLLVTLGPEGTPAPFSLEAPEATSEFSVALPIYDLMGRRKAIQLFFTSHERREDATVWEYNATMPASDVDNFGSSGLVILGSGFLLVKDNEGGHGHVDLGMVPRGAGEFQVIALTITALSIPASEPPTAETFKVTNTP